MLFKVTGKPVGRDRVSAPAISNIKIAVVMHGSEK
jgi:hypothetical protein